MNLRDQGEVNFIFKQSLAHNELYRQPVFGS